jgi:asparagine synthase (glutamine-hydrolysing)
MGLAHGVEGRVPLLDDGVIRAAFAIPPAQRVGSTGLKASLRRAVADVLPRPVLERRWKLGFHAPVPVYVDALDEALRSGHRTTCDVFGGGPEWESLNAPARWSWGALGSYLGWVRARSGRGPTSV